MPGGGTSHDVGDYCVLDVGEAIFHVHDRYVGRERRAADPGCLHEQTCFYLPGQYIPAAERIAAVLLQLKNNPALFGGWAAKGEILKPDGEVFEIRPEPPPC